MPDDPLRLRVVHLDVQPHVSGRLVIWLNPARNTWCVGPERGPLSDAVLMMQQPPHEFFVIAAIHSRAEEG